MTKCRAGFATGYNYYKNYGYEIKNILFLISGSFMPLSADLHW